MPDISASLRLLDATCFLYPSKEAAERGTGFGGSGVVVGVPLISRADLFCRYVITNWHVVCQGGSSVVRLTLPDDGVHIVELEPHEWIFLPGKQDLAAIPLNLPQEIQPMVVSSTVFITDGERSDAHVGDDVFMVGRFIDFDGKETNKPSVRFGSISMMAAPILQPTGFSGRSIIVDMHCRTGFSGSPVYVYRPGGSTVLTGANFAASGVQPLGQLAYPASHRKWGIGNDVNVRLLGLLWGQFPERWEIGSGTIATAADASLIANGAYVKGFSGMSCVVPAIQILELLDVPVLKFQREAISAHHATSHIPIPQ